MDEADSVKVVFRPHVHSDHPFIYASWRNGMFYGSELKLKEPRSTFRDLTHKIRHILKSATVLVACLEDSPETIIGYSIVEGTILHWVYVKEDYRNQRIATLLIPKSINQYGDIITEVAKAILKKKKEKEYGQEKRRSPKDNS